MEIQLSNNKAARLETMHQYQIFDPKTEKAFSDLAFLATQICGTPITLINLVYENHQWFKSKIDLDITQLLCDVGLCHLWIEQKDIIVVSDTLADERTKVNPVVIGHPYIRFYAGAPLITPEGNVIGTLCVLDQVPRSLSSEQVEGLRILSHQVISQLELQRNLAKLAFSTNNFQRSEEMLRQSEEHARFALDFAQMGEWNFDILKNTTHRSLKHEQAFGYDSLLSNWSYERFLEHVHPEDRDFVNQKFKSALLGGEEYNVEFRAIWPEQSIHWIWLRGRVYQDLNGKPIRIAGIVTDVTQRKQAESERERFFSLSLHMLCITGFDGYFKLLNPAWEKTFGFTKEELLAKPYIEFIHPEDRTATIAEVQKSASGLETIGFENRYLCKDGSYKWLLWNAVPFAEQELIYCIAHDITERKRAEEELREMSLALENAVEGISRLDIQGRYITVNRAYASNVGYQPEEMIGMEWQATVHPEDRENMMAAYQYMLTNGKVEVEIRGVRKDGSIFYEQLVMTSAYDEQQKFSGNYCFMKDVSERKQTEEQLRHQACHDALTGLPNRVLFVDRVDHAIKRIKRQKDYLFAVLFLDLDRFKVVNDSLGHIIGDQLLVAIARRLEACLRPIDTVARLGGDEFTILLENINDISDATQIAERIQKELSLPFSLSGHEVFAAASIGIALSTTGYNRPEDILRDADTTMYRAKALGKARSEVFNLTMHTQLMARLQLENDLQRALQRQEFQLHYQPIISLKNNKITGFEALLRWHRPEYGLVAAADFIPIAEETGLIILIGWWVLREACRQMRAWQKQFDLNSSLTISVNLSGKQFSQPDLIQQIEQILQETTLDPCSLKLEITESVLVENAKSASTMLVQLQALGIRLSIDDFGTGYSSLSYLHQFPIDTLKIDGSFINNVDIDVEKIEIVRTIVSLAWNLSMDVVAEGVETNKQMYQIKSLKCDFGQGYFFSKPLDREAAEALIASELHC